MAARPFLHMQVWYATKVWKTRSQVAAGFAATRAQPWSVPND